MLCSMWTPSLMLLGIKILLQTHCTNNLMLAEHVRFIMQKKSNCTGYVGQIQYVLIPFWTCWALVEDDTCTSLANRHIRLLSAWKSQIRAAPAELRQTTKIPLKSWQQGFFFSLVSHGTAALPSAGFYLEQPNLNKPKSFPRSEDKIQEVCSCFMEFIAEWNQEPGHWHSNQSPTHQSPVWHPKSKGCCFCTKQNLNKCIYFAETHWFCSVL